MLKITNKWWPLTTLNRWLLCRIKIYSKMHRESSNVTVLNRFDYKQQRYREDASNYSKNVTKYLIFFCSDKSHHFGKDCENLYTVNSLLLATVVHNPHPLCSQILGRKNLVCIYNLHQLLTCSCGGQMRKWGLKFVKKNV